MVNLACVGVGGWGKNLVRTFHSLPHCQLLYLCDLDKERLEEVGRSYPEARQTTSFEQILKDDQVQGVVIAATFTNVIHPRSERE